MSGNDRMSAIALTACGRGRGGNGDGASGDASPSDKLRRFVEGGAGIGGEAGLRLPGGRFPGGMRPHVGLIRSGHGSVRRVLGLDVLDTARSRLGVEVYDRPRERVRGLKVRLEHRF